MRRIDSLRGVLAGTIVMAGIFVSRTETGIAEPNLAAIARSVTVQINGTDRQYTYDGSGVLIGKRGNTYAVLTNNHVVCQADTSRQCRRSVRYRIRTADGRDHTLTGTPKTPFGAKQIDLAVVYFESPHDYKTATLGNSDTVQESDPLTVYGYPGVEGLSGSHRKAFLSQGFLIRRQHHQAGYGFRLSALTAGGMSGGPILDRQGRVVGIFGRKVVSGVPLGIPMQLFQSTLATNAPWAAFQIQQDPTSNPSLQPAAAAQTAEDYYIQGLGQLDRGQAQVSTKSFTQALQHNPKLVPAYNSRGYARNLLGDDRGAIADYTQALTLDPKNRELYGNRGIAKDELGDHRGAIADYTAAIRLDANDADTFYNRALAYHNLGDYPKAITDYTQAIRRKPNDAEALSNRGDVRNQVDDPHGAIQDYSEAIQANPRFAAAYANRGGVRSRLGDPNGAIADCNRALQVDPNSARAYMVRGSALISLGKSQAAIGDLRKAAQLYQQQGDQTNQQVSLGMIQQLHQQLQPVAR